MAKYRALVDLYLPSGVYVQAGSIITDAGLSPDVPPTWQPPTAVDPIDADAITKFWTAGPAGQSNAEPNRSLGPWFLGGRWTGVPVAAPVIYWVAVLGSTTHQFILTGAGAALGPTNIVRGSVIT